MTTQNKPAETEVKAESEAMKMLRHLKEVSRAQIRDKEVRVRHFEWLPNGGFHVPIRRLKDL